MDLAVCTSCGTDFRVHYPGGMFAHCTQQTPGVLFWITSDALRADDRDTEVEVRGGVLPQPGSDLPDLSRDVCPKCSGTGTLLLALPDTCECPRCHTGRLNKVGDWIQ